MGTDPHTAGELFAEAARAWPRNCYVWNFVGAALASTGEPPHVVSAAFRRAVEVNPRYFHGWLSLGRALLMERDVNGAVAALRRARALATDHPRELSEVEEVIYHIRASGALDQRTEL